MLPYTVRGAVWLILYLFFILAPLFALLAGTLPPTRDFWTEFSVAIGYSGLAMMGMQFGLTARFRHVTEPWGEDVIYHFHRQISLIAVGLVIAHPIILFVVRPELVALLNFIQAPWRARFATLSTYSLGDRECESPLTEEQKRRLLSMSLGQKISYRAPILTLS